MGGKDEARREVYKLKEEPERKRWRKKREKGEDEEIEENEREKKVRKESGGIHRRKIFVRPTLYSKLV